MKPQWRRLLPLPAAFLLGVLGSLLLGTGPRSTTAADAGQEAWALPANPAPDLSATDAVWNERHPWGRPPVTEAEAAAAAVPVAVPVGVVESRGGLQALFSLDGALPVAVDAGGTTPDGGTVTSIAATVITWQDAAGRSKRHELFLEESSSGSTAGGAALPNRGAQGLRQGAQTPPASSGHGSRPRSPGSDRQSRQRSNPDHRR